MKVVALFGGSFNPPHQGHTNIIDGLVNKLHICRDGRPVVIEECWVLVQENHAFSKDLLPVGFRVEMVKYAINYTMGLSARRHRVMVVPDTNMYMIDTLDQMRALNRGYEFILVMGEDCYNERDKWHRWAEIEASTEIKVIPRGFEGSTQIREQLARNDLAGLVGVNPQIAPEVFDLIRANGFYGYQSPEKVVMETTVETMTFPFPKEPIEVITLRGPVADVVSVEAHGAECEALVVLDSGITAQHLRYEIRAYGGGFQPTKVPGMEILARRTGVAVRGSRIQGVQEYTEFLGRVQEYAFEGVKDYTFWKKQVHRP